MNMWQLPYTIYASVLLLDNKIVNWKIGQRGWRTIPEAYMSGQPDIVFDNFGNENMRTEILEMECKTKDDHSKAFNEWSESFFRRWEIHPDFPEKCFAPYDTEAA